METELLLSFLLASILLTLMPGPDNIFVLTESLTKGRRNGIAVSMGLCSGVFIHVFVASTGLSLIIQQSAFIFSLLKYLGAIYLLYLAFTEISERRPMISYDSASIVKEKKIGQLMRKGFFMSVLNPKVSLFFIAFLPQFISKSGFNISLQMLILGLLFILQALIIFIAISFLSSKFTAYLSSNRFWKLTKWSKVSVLSLLALSIAFFN